jgi:Uma2 family endonuclease
MENKVKEAASKYNFISPEEYLAMERALTNPSVIIEILSVSTQHIGKGRKFFFYRQIPSLKEYIMIDSKKRFIQTAGRQNDDLWKFEDLNETAISLTIQTIDLALPINDIYRNTGL